MNQEGLAFKRRRLNELLIEKEEIEKDIREYDEQHGMKLLIPEKIEMTPQEKTNDHPAGVYVITILQGAVLGAAECGRVARFMNLYATTHGAKGV